MMLRSSKNNEQKAQIGILTRQSQTAALVSRHISQRPTAWTKKAEAVTTMAAKMGGTRKSMFDLPTIWAGRHMTSPGLSNGNLKEVPWRSSHARENSVNGDKREVNANSGLTDATVTTAARNVVHKMVYTKSGWRIKLLHRAAHAFNPLETFHKTPGMVKGKAMENPAAQETLIILTSIRIIKLKPAHLMDGPLHEKINIRWNQFSSTVNRPLKVDRLPNWFELETSPCTDWRELSNKILPQDSLP